MRDRRFVYFGNEAISLNRDKAPSIRGSDAAVLVGFLKDLGLIVGRLVRRAVSEDEHVRVRLVAQLQRRSRLNDNEAAGG